MATVNFLYRSGKPDGPLTARLLFSHNGKNYVFSKRTREVVNKAVWEADKSKDITIINKRFEYMSGVNKLMTYILTAFESARPEQITSQWLDRQVDFYYAPARGGNEIPESLIDFIDFYISDRKDDGEDITEKSVNRYNVIKSKLQKYEKHTRRTIYINQVDNQFKQDLLKYLKNDGYSLSTIARDFIYVKAFCKHAKSKGMDVSLQLDNFKIKIPRKETEKKMSQKIFLSNAEIEQIENKEGLSESLSNVRDWLLISCHTGQRVSDFMRFKKDMITYQKDKGGVLRPLIEFTQIKTGAIVKIPLHQKIVTILEKRAGEFPEPISDQRYNEYLKDLCRDCEINTKIEGSKTVRLSKGKIRKQEGTFEKWKLISSHVGRRSFATNWYGKIPTSRLIRYTGHTTEKTLRAYLDKSNEDTLDEMIEDMNYK